jgi:S-adenosylmethionine-diacylglycerol 3-amino-3-carboxypropyl transferase
MAALEIGPRSQVVAIASGGCNVMSCLVADPASMPPDLLRPWAYGEARSRERHARDRSAVYGGFHLYRRAG